MTEAILALGSNLGDKKLNLIRAIKSLNLVPGIETLKVSNFYETEPFGVPDKQENYINCCVRVSTSLSAHVLLGVCLGIEAAMGRTREFKFSSRVIDIDLILYGDFTCDTDELKLPHPGIRERAFVIIPMSDICKEKLFYSFDFSKAFKTIDKSGVTLFDIFKPENL